MHINRSKVFKLLFFAFFLIFLLIMSFFLWRSSSSRREKTVPIAMALDDGYLYPTIVSITSMMENAKKGTVYNLYINSAILRPSYWTSLLRVLPFAD